MKIAIDISKDRYDEIMSMDWKNCRLIFDEELRAIHDGKALEQEPCKDTISRKAVIDIIEDVCPIYGNDYRYILRDKVNELPPVTAEKVGHYDEFGFIDPFSFRKDTENDEVLDKIRDEIVHLHDWAFDREGILRIIDKYKSESEG